MAFERNSDSPHGLVEKVINAVLTNLSENRKYSMRESSKKSKDWISDIKLKSGTLSKALGIPEEENIPVSLLKKMKKDLQKKAEGDKTLTKKEKSLLGKIMFALNIKGKKE